MQTQPQHFSVHYVRRNSTAAQFHHTLTRTTPTPRTPRLRHISSCGVSGLISADIYRSRPGSGGIGVRHPNLLLNPWPPRRHLHLLSRVNQQPQPRRPHPMFHLRPPRRHLHLLSIVRQRPQPRRPNLVFHLPLRHLRPRYQDRSASSGSRRR